MLKGGGIPEETWWVASSGIALINIEHTEFIDLVFSLCEIAKMELFYKSSLRFKKKNPS